MIIDVESYTIEAIQEKDAWRICDFITANTDRLKRYFPQTLAQNLNPTLATTFATKKAAEFKSKKEFLFTLKEKEQRTIIGLVYVKKIDWNAKQAELAYCIGYQYARKGITSKTVRYISNWAFDELHLKSLQIITHKSNLASVGVAEKCGYTWQKTLLKEHTPPNEKPLDMELFELYNEG